MNVKQKNGQKAEELACAYLKCQGIGILARNYRCRQGEIDIVGWEKDVLVFVEVKAREGSGSGYPGEALTLWKIRRICHTAAVYCSKEKIPHDQSIRFDVVEILGDRIRHIRNAFDYRL